MKRKRIINYILVIYLLIQPLLDVIATTKLNTINILIRAIFLAFMTVFLLINRRNLKLLILIAVMILMIVGYNYLNHENIYNIINSSMKLLYLPITLIFFHNIWKVIGEKHLLYVLLIYLLLFILSYIFGFGYNNYTVSDAKHGFRGVFNSINEISAIIISIFPISINYLKANKKIVLQIILTLLVFMVALLTGTKVLMVGLIIILIFTYYKNIFNIYKKFNSKKKIVSIIIFILLISVFLYLLTFTRFYTNMVIQNNFFKVSTIPDFINKVLFNNRLEFLATNFNFFIKQNILTYLFGIGYFNIAKLVEIDIFDILFGFGIIGLLLVLIPSIYVIKNTKFKTLELFSIILLILISLTSGHVLLNPNVLIYFGYITNLLAKEYNN